MTAATKPLNVDILTAQTMGGLPVTTAQARLDSLNMLIYGDSSVGKTWLAGSASEVASMAPVLFIDVEGGSLTLGSAFPSVDIVRITEWKELDDIYGELYSMKHQYKTVVIDSLTELQYFNMERIMAELVKKGRSSGKDVDPDVPDQREWGISRSQIRRVVTAFRDLPMHTIFTALAKVEKSKRTGLETTLPSLPGKLANEIPALVDMVLYMYVKLVNDTTNRLLLTSRTEKEIAKDRSGSLPRVIPEPTMKMILDLATRNEETK